jgi:hypothetical protein
MYNGMLTDLSKAHITEMTRNAEKNRMANAIKRGRHVTNFSAVRINIGRVMVGTGRFLRRRSDPPVQLQPNLN